MEKKILLANYAAELEGDKTSIMRVGSLLYSAFRSISRYCSGVMKGFDRVDMA
jgi:hypothetical protein